jgi:hypothetical protein
MKKIITSIIGFSFFVTLSYAQNKLIKFDEVKLLERLEILSSDKFEGRKTGEKGNDSARAYIMLGV